MKNWLLQIVAVALALAPLAGCQPVMAKAPRPLTASPLAPATATAQDNFINVRAIILVRHGDVSVAQKRLLGNQTPLLERGQERAKELAYALKDAGITRIVTTEALRTQETAAVLANELHLTLETPFTHNALSKSGDPKKREQSDVLTYLAQNAKPDEVVLLVHHHTVIPSLLRELGYPDEPEFNDRTEFDRLYLILPNAKTRSYRIMRLRYGGDWHRN